MQTLGKLATITGLVVGLSAGTPSLSAAASITDTPLPMLNGATKNSKHIYSVTGVRNGTGITTRFICTSLEKTGGSSFRWGVEVVDFDGTLENDVTMGES